MRLKKPKIYKDIHLLPLKNWVMLNENNDMSYLYEKNQKPQKKDKLDKVFEQLQYQVFDIIGVEMALITAWSNYITNYSIYVNNELINSTASKINGANAELIRSGKKEKIRYVKNPSAKYNNSFFEYLNVLQKYYKDFQIIEYSLVADFEKKFKEFYGIDVPEMILNNIIPSFYTLNDFYGNLNKIDKTIENLGLINFFLSKTFFDNFIETNFIKINDLVEYHTSLQKSYQKNRNFPAFMVDKRIMFDLQNIKKTPKNNTTISDEIAVVSRILKYQINTDIMSVAEFYNTIKMLEKEPKKSNEIPKPQAN